MLTDEEIAAETTPGMKIWDFVWKICMVVGGITVFIDWWLGATIVLAPTTVCYYLRCEKYWRLSLKDRSYRPNYHEMFIISLILLIMTGVSTYFALP